MNTTRSLLYAAVIGLLVIVLLIVDLACHSDTITSGNNNKDTTATDADGNVYQSVKMGRQVWTVENLRTTKYNDGSPIPNFISNTAWDSCRYTQTGAYCYYDNTTDSGSIKKYGALYNWYAVNTGKLAPAGWHVPTDADWSVLAGYLYTGARRKESGFSALLGGYRTNLGGFGYQSRYGCWWSATECNVREARDCFLFYDKSGMYRYCSLKQDGLSVRLVRD